MGALPLDPCCAEAGTCHTAPYDYTVHLVDVDVVTIVLGFLLLAGTVISVIPQIIKLVKTKSTVGVSFHMLILAAYNQWSTIINYVMAQYSKIQACNISFGACWANLISLYQAIALFICYFILLHQFIYYEHKLGKSKEHSSHLLNYVLFVAFAAATIPATMVPGTYFGSCSTVYQTFAFLFSLLASILSCIEWIPQIMTTYRLKSAGSFSITAMLIQCPGCAVSLIVTIMSGNPWYTWLSWIVSFLLELILVLCLVYYHFRGKDGKGTYRNLEDAQPRADEQSK